jgi:hypothetical protein
MTLYGANVAITATKPAPAEREDLSGWVISTATLAGHEHLRLGRNNQDAVAVAHLPLALIGCVADGCSSAPHSEVGAKLGAHWTVDFLSHSLVRLDQGRDPSCVAAEPDLLGAKLARRLDAYLTRKLTGLARGLALGSAAADRAAVVRDYLLFTLLTAVITPTRVMIIGIGDGLWLRNDALTVLDSGPDNAPSYLGYRLLAHDQAWRDGHEARLSENRALQQLTLRYEGSSLLLDSLFIATDGMASIASAPETERPTGLRPGSLFDFGLEQRYARNPSLMQKQLNLIAGDRCLADDTTAVLFRRKKAAGAEGERR